MSVVSVVAVIVTTTITDATVKIEIGICISSTPSCEYPQKVAYSAQSEQRPNGLVSQRRCHHKDRVDTKANKLDPKGKESGMTSAQPMAEYFESKCEKR